MKKKPGISADLSLPFSVCGESQRYDSDPETSSKRHRNGMSEQNIFQEIWGDSRSLTVFAGESWMDHLTTP